VGIVFAGIRHFNDVENDSSIIYHGTEQGEEEKVRVIVMYRHFSSLLVKTSRTASSRSYYFTPSARYLSTTIPRMSDKKDILTAYKVSAARGYFLPHT
jgi:hypothetical protein